ncbi:MAG TPA: UDP-N-acetylmuramate--L-alanine ligase [Acidimicrobiales bacterium]|jgi:UDP-N-acetylmuramate--alanine ligase|nr:UDP-N-acetylmuramate--L-alanine ligase [Acidimicrobiales bacterium]
MAEDTAGGKSPEPVLDLATIHRIHVVGVGGVGMSALASVLVAMGQRVSGSDLKASAEMERLRSLGVDAHVGHDTAYLDGVEVVTISTAIPAANIEVVDARRRGIPVLPRAAVLAAIAATRHAIAVAGTHGKTTTASMLALVLVEAGMRPSFIIGGDINEVGSGAAWGSGDWLVVEADESDGTFLALRPEVALVTNVEPDHLDYYGGREEMEQAFGRFLHSAGAAIVCADDPVAAALGRQVGAITYGTAPGADYQMVDLQSARSSSRFDVVHEGRRLGPFQLAVPGGHNARNACGALVAGLTIGAPVDAARRAFGRYGGVARRFEFRGERDGITFVDDYAHLPSEVRAALAAALDGGWERVVAVFQPHRFSRVASLWQDFADAFVDADVLAVTDVYGAGERPRPGVSGRLILDAVTAAHPDTAAHYLPTHHELVDFLRQELRPGDLCLTLGAGDLTLLPDELLEEAD